MPFADDCQSEDDQVLRGDEFPVMEDQFSDNFGAEVNTTFRPSESIDDDSDFSHLLES